MKVKWGKNRQIINENEDNELKKKKKKEDRKTRF